MEYFPFGTYRETVDYDVNFPDVFYTFTGQEDDDDLGLYNYGARLYDPALGRFISPDSIVPDPTDLQSLNRYSYVRNNPLFYIDPTGHCGAPGEEDEEDVAPTTVTTRDTTDPDNEDDDNPTYSIEPKSWTDPKTGTTIDPSNYRDSDENFHINIDEYGSKNGPRYGAYITVYSKGKVVTAPASSWSNLGYPDIEEGTYNAVYFSKGVNRTKQPGIRIENGDPVPTLGPNPKQGGQSLADGVVVHCGKTSTNRGSKACPTIDPSFNEYYCKEVFNILSEGQQGTFTLRRGGRDK